MMIINVLNNGKILQEQLNIYLPDLTILTGENGSGKTQLLETFRDNAHGYWERHEQDIHNSGGENSKMIYPIHADDETELKDIIFSYPGLKRNEYEYQQEKPLIQQIKEQWNILFPIAKSYIFIKDKAFSDEKSELDALNRAIIDFVKNLTSDTKQFSDRSLKKAGQHQLTQLKTLATQANKTIDELTFIDFLMFYPVPTQVFSSALNLLFHQFYLKKKYYPNLTQDVSPPWDVFNDLLDKASFKYISKYTPANNEESIPAVSLLDKSNNKDVYIDNLSSGEKTIMALIFVLYHAASNGKFPQVILFDEPDAHLHPSLTQLFLSVIEDVLVKERKVKVILTTHSPSTIALAPPDTIYRMDRDKGYPIKEEKNSAIQALSNGLASVTIEEGNMGVSFNIKNTEKHILFTEGVTDKIILGIAWGKLYPNEEMPFFIQDCFCASFLSNLFVNGNQKQDGIFELEPDKVMIALFDFDQAGYNAWNRIKHFQDIENDPYKCFTKSNGKNAYALLLPVPDIPEIQSQVIKHGNNTFKDKSLLTIESLLFNATNFKSTYFAEDILPGGGSSFQFKGDKRKFALSLEDLDTGEFREFTRLFEKIGNIIRQHGK